MFNRYTYVRDEQAYANYEKYQRQFEKYQNKKKQQSGKMIQNYKGRVRDFLVHVTSKPIKINDNIPPITDITRKYSHKNILGNSQMYINGFKNNSQRIKKEVEDHQILDISHAQLPIHKHEFRNRSQQRQIQPAMHFHSKNKSVKSMTKLPKIENPETKMYFKGVLEIANKIDSMKLNQYDRMGLINRLQTVNDGSHINLQKASMKTLKRCKVLRQKYNQTGI